MRESIFSNALRAFFVALFAMVGIFVAIFSVLFAFSAVTGTGSIEPEAKYSQEIFPNANGSRKVLAETSPVVLKINIEGVIGTEQLNMQTIRTQLMESREGSLKNDRVKAILLYINSPGGTVVDADGIYHAIKDYKEKHKVPVFAYVNGLCASGGMYIAAAADQIYSSDVSLIGSVGVLVPTILNFSELLEKYNVHTMTLTAGKGKDALNPLRPWVAGEEKPLQSIINYYYDRFIDILTSNRPALDKKALIEVYGASIFNPKDAKEYGFINDSGYSIEKTLTLLVKQVGIEDDYYQVIQHENKNWFSSLLKGEFSLLKGKVQHQVSFLPQLDAKLMDQFLYLYQPEKNLN